MISQWLHEIFYSLTLLFVISLGYDFNSTMPMPPVVMSRYANLSKPRLVIPFFVEYHRAAIMYIPLQTSLVIEKLAEATPYLKDFELEVNLYETYCEDSPAVNGYMAILEGAKRNLPYIATYACAMKGQKLLAEVVNYYNYTATGLLDVVNDAIQNRQRYRNYFTLGATIVDMQNAMLKFMKLQNWSRVALFGEDELVYYKEVSPNLFSSIFLFKFNFHSGTGFFCPSWLKIRLI